MPRYSSVYGTSWGRAQGCEPRPQIPAHQRPPPNVIGGWAHWAHTQARTTQLPTRHTRPCRPHNSLQPEKQQPQLLHRGSSAPSNNTPAVRKHPAYSCPKQESLSGQTAINQRLLTCRCTHVRACGGVPGLVCPSIHPPPPHPSESTITTHSAGRAAQTAGSIPGGTRS